MTDAFALPPIPTIALVADRDPNLSTRLYEAVIRDRGVTSVRFDVVDVMRDITNVTGSNLLDFTKEDPYATHAGATSWTLSSESALRRVDAVIVDTDEFTAYVALIISVLHDAGLLQVNSVASTTVARDKWLTHLCMEAAGLPVARTRLAFTHAEAMAAATDAGFPLVVKETASSFGDGVRLVATVEQLLVALDQMGIDRQPLLIQDYIECGASDKRIVLVNGSPMGMMQRQAKDGDFRANLSQGGSAVAAVPTPRERLLAISATKALGLDFVGLDIARVAKSSPGRDYLKPGDVFVIEANSCAALGRFKETTGVNAAPAVVALLIRKIMARYSATMPARSA